MAVATGGVIAAGVVITMVGAEAEAITTAGATTAGETIVNHEAPPCDMDSIEDSPRAKPAWTQHELARLILLARERATAAKAAKVLGRRVSSVRRQAREQGILLYKN